MKLLAALCYMHAIENWPGLMTQGLGPPTHLASPQPGWHRSGPGDDGDDGDDRHTWGCWKTV